MNIHNRCSDIDRDTESDVWRQYTTRNGCIIDTHIYIHLSGKAQGINQVCFSCELKHLSVCLRSGIQNMW